MGALVLVVPGDFQTLTGGYAYDRRIVAGLRNRGWAVDVRELHGSFPRATAAALDHAARVLAGIPDGGIVLVDGLAFGAMPAVVEREAARLRLVALVHHPLAAETGLDAASAAAFAAGERRSLACARHVIVTSRATATLLAAYNVPPDRITVAEPGTDRPSAIRDQPSAIRFQPPATSHQPLRFLCVATLIPRKGHDILFRALAGIPERNWRLTCIGSLDRDPETVARLGAQLCDEGLEELVTLTGEMSGDALNAEYARADCFVLPTLYEGYGMAVAEALAHGVPVISTPTGGIEDLVRGVRLLDRRSPAGGGQADIDQPIAAGLLVPPGDVDALASALTRVLTDASVRDQLGRGAQQARDRLPTWDEAVGKIAAALNRVARFD